MAGACVPAACSSEKSAAWRGARFAGLALAAWALLFALVAPAPGAAQRAVLRRPALHWVRGPGADACIDARALAEAVEELVGPVLVRAAESENSIEGYVESLTGSGLRVRLRVLDAGGHPAGERVLEHPTNECAQLAPAIAFVIAMMIDPGVAAHGLPPALVALLADELPGEALLDELESGAPEGLEAGAALAPAVEEPRQQVAIPAPPEVRPAAPALDDGSAPAVRGPLGLQLGLLARAAFGEAPFPVWSAESRLHVELAARLSAAAYLRGGTHAGEHEFPPSQTLRLAVVGAGMLVCAGQPSAALVRIHGCFGAELHGARARVEGLEAPRSPFRADAGLVAQLSARARLYRRFGLALILSGRVNLGTMRFVYDDAQGVSQLAYASERRSFGVALGPTYEF